MPERLLGQTLADTVSTDAIANPDKATPQEINCRHASGSLTLRLIRRQTMSSMWTWHC